MSVLRTSALALICSATAIVTPALTGTATAAPVINEYTIPFTATAISAASGSEAWLAGSVNGTANVARVLNGAVTTYSATGSTWRNVQVVSTGPSRAYLFGSGDAGENLPIWRFTGTSLAKSTIPTSMTLASGQSLTLRQIAGSPNAGLWGMFTGYDGWWAVSNRAARWDGSQWVADAKAPCWDAEEGETGTLTATQDGWLAHCRNPYTPDISLDGSTFSPEYAPTPVTSPPAVAARSVNDVYTFGNDYDRATGAGYINWCLHLVSGVRTPCAQPPQKIASATMTNTGQVYVAGESAFYRYVPWSKSYAKVSDGSSLNSRLSAAPYSPVVWGLNGSTVFRAE